MEVEQLPNCIYSNKIEDLNLPVECGQNCNLKQLILEGMPLDGNINTQSTWRLQCQKPISVGKGVSDD